MKIGSAFYLLQIEIVPPPSAASSSLAFDIPNSNFRSSFNEYTAKENQIKALSGNLLRGRVSRKANKIVTITEVFTLRRLTFRPPSAHTENTEIHAHLHIHNIYVKFQHIYFKK